MPTNCGIYVHQCKDPHCYQCEIKRLKITIQEQQSIINFLKESNDKSNLRKIDPELFTECKGKREIVPNNKKIDINNVWFITITFDPSRFNDLGLDLPQEEQYILYKVALAHNQLLFNWCYGCFELQSNGTTHAHLMCNSYNPQELNQFLKEQFTYNMRNQICIKTLPADANCQTYLNKVQEDKGCERKTWFYLNKHLIRYIKEELITDYRDKPEYKKEKAKNDSKKKELKQKNKKPVTIIYSCPNK